MHKRRTHSAYAIFSDDCLLKPKRRANYLRHHVNLIHLYDVPCPRRNMFHIGSRCALRIGTSHEGKVLTNVRKRQLSLTSPSSCLFEQRLERTVSAELCFCWVVRLKRIVGGESWRLIETNLADRGLLEGSCDLLSSSIAKDAYH